MYIYSKNRRENTIYLVYKLNKLYFLRLFFEYTNALAPKNH